MTELEELCAQLTCGDDDRAEIAAVRLAGFGREAFMVLRLLLKSEETDVRWWAIRALAGFGQLDEAAADLLVFLDDASEELRQAAAMAFCQHPTPRALAALARALSDPDAMTARLAANALAGLGVQSTPALLEILESGPQSARLEAVRALAEIKDPQAIPGLMKALESNSALLQYWAGLGLDHLGVGMLYFNPE